MNYDYEELVPQWYTDEDQKSLVLTDDIDSLVSCAILKQVKGWNIDYFYSFDKAYASEELKKAENRHERVWVDAAVKNEKAFDNHVSRIDLFDIWNEEMINPNIMVGVSNDCYYEKYAGSTALLIWSLYGLELPKTEEGKMLLLCIDSAYLGFYSRYRDTQEYYIDEVLGLTELVDVINRHKKSEFEDVKEHYRINDKIIFKDGKLNTRLQLKMIGGMLGLNLEIPTNTFKVWKRFITSNEALPSYATCTDDISTKIFSIAFTGKNHINYSREIKERKNNVRMQKNEIMQLFIKKGVQVS